MYHGEIVTMLTSLAQAKGYNYGFVEYDDPGAAERAMQTLNGRRVHQMVGTDRCFGHEDVSRHLTRVDRKFVSIGPINPTRPTKRTPRTISTSLLGTFPTKSM